jgi:hypothetical protein
LSCILFVYSCGPKTAITGGGGSETTNSITVCVKENQVSGQAASRANVEVYLQTFDPIIEILPDSLKIEADSTGRFVFPRIRDGAYNIYSKYDSAGSFHRALFITSIKVPSDTEINQMYLLPVDLDVTLVKEKQRQLPGTLVSARLFLRGSPFYMKEDLVSTDHYTFEEIPIASYNCEMKIEAAMSTEYVKFDYPDSVNLKEIEYSTRKNQIIIYAKNDTMGVMP